ncbi:MAG TPA: ATP-dependent DNA ligase [Mycobacteriales bacterium]|nr:ATP-dependent DNA ligase [Mycobacteriales bacterium]
MKLPVMPPVSPMLAKSVREIPKQTDVAGGVSYEPKWDGFRCIVFRDGDEVELGSRNERPLTRYFPEVVEAVKAALPERCVVDGEIIVGRDGRLDFEALQQRIHPAESRVRRLAAETPAQFVAFDLLAIGDDALLAEPFARRRERLEAAVTRTDSVQLTPATRDEGVAADWFKRFEGAGLDGLVVKPLDVTYQQDKRVMFKVKHERTADCVLTGFRWHKSGPVVGSLLLGLYDDSGDLRHVGVAASFPMARRKALVDELAPLREGAADNHPWLAGGFGPGSVPNRWNAGKDMSFEPLRPERVVEVGYDYMEGSRFRHTAQFKRWRDDRDPASCTFDQLDRPLVLALDEVLTIQ